MPTERRLSEGPKALTLTKGTANTRINRTFFLLFLTLWKVNSRCMTDGDFLNVNKYITRIYKLHPNTNMALGPQKPCGAQGLRWGWAEAWGLPGAAGSAALRPVEGERGMRGARP